MFVINGRLRANTSFLGILSCCGVHAHPVVRSLKQQQNTHLNKRFKTYRLHGICGVFCRVSCEEIEV